MIVFLSDIHFTDAKITKTINSGAFEKFGFYLREMAATAGAREIEIVLLGDIFDVIRSDMWLESDTIRPWSSPETIDAHGGTLEKYTAAIVNGICENADNRNARSHMYDLKKYFADKDISFKVTYITGNHDWLINRYPEVRRMVADFFYMQEDYGAMKFSESKLWPEYRAFARHGDMYDPMNFSGDRDKSSLGDAIVIDLLTRFHKSFCDYPAMKEDREIASLLDEIDNVRPNLEIPAWVYGICLRTSSSKAALIKKVWNETVDSFLRIPYVKSFDRKWCIDKVDLMGIVLKITKFFSLRRLALLPLSQFKVSSQTMAKCAYNEPAIKTDEVDFVLYGHTHTSCIQPLDLFPKQNGLLSGKLYFNTGTWRKVHQRTLFDTFNFEFMNHHEMTFVALYKENERINSRGQKHRFEVWHGSLG